jgi:TonB family protein
MFHNLIESSSHVGEYKRRGSFLLFTTVIYAVLFVASGVAAIYAYDAKLEKQNLEMVVLISPHEIVPEQPPAVAQPPQRPISDTEKDIGIPQREVAMSDVDRPELVPHKPSAAPNPNLPLPPSGPYKIGPGDINPLPAAGGAGSSSGGGRQAGQPVRVVELPDNPPLPEPQKQKTIVSREPINGRAISLPKPIYPELAKRMRVSGKVNVQVLIDETGRVVSATVVSGSPFLRAEAQKAAMQARFSPTRLGDQPVKVSGVIIYNFELSN